MTYIATDATTYSGQPVHLIKFDYQTTTYRYTTGAEDFNDGLNTWTAEEIEPLQNLSLSENLEKATIELVTRLENPIAQLFRTSAIESSVTVQIYETHVNDNEIVLIHSGRVLARHVKLTGKKREAVLKCEPLITAQKRPAIREKTGYTCPYVLYDGSTCKATKAPVFGTVLTVSGNSMTVSNADSVTSGYLVAGYIETSEEKRMITAHSGTSISVTTAMQGLEVGDAVTMYIGCDHTTSDCSGKHDNIVNYGGEPYIPSKNPHEGRMI